MTTPVERLQGAWLRKREGRELRAAYQALSADERERFELDLLNPGLVQRAVQEAFGGRGSLPFHLSALYEMERYNSAK